MASLLDDPMFLSTMGLGLLQSAQKGPRQNVGANLLSSLQQYAQGDAQRRSTAIAESENARRQAAQEQADRERQRASLLQQDFVTNAIGQKGGAFDAQLFPGEAPIPGLLNEPKGIVGGMLSPQEFYAKAAGVPGYESTGMSGLARLAEEEMKANAPPNEKPYYSPLETANEGLVRFNHRTGQIEKLSLGGDDKLVKPSSDPALQRKIAEGKAAGDVAGKSAEQAAIDLPTIMDASNYSIDLVRELKDHPGMPLSVGKSSILRPWLIPGTPSANFKSRLDQVAGKQFLEAFESLKGGGQITEIEGNKATQAIARMQTSQSEEEFKKSADEFIKVIEQGMSRAQRKAGGADPAPTAPQKTYTRYGRNSKGERVGQLPDGTVEVVK